MSKVILAIVCVLLIMAVLISRFPGDNYRWKDWLSDVFISALIVLVLLYF